MNEQMTVLQEAESLINGDRAATYGDAKESFNRIAGMWSAYLGTEVTGLDVTNMMILLKVSRTKGGYHRDSYVDIGGYAGLGERIDGPTDELGDFGAVPRPARVWNHLNEVPDDVVTRSNDGYNFRWVENGCDLEIQVNGEWKSYSGDASYIDHRGPFTEVIA